MPVNLTSSQVPFVFVRTRLAGGCSGLLAEYQTRNREVAGSTHTRSTAYALMHACINAFDNGMQITAYLQTTYRVMCHQCTKKAALQTDERSLPPSVCIRRQKTVVYERHLVHSSFTSSHDVTYVYLVYYSSLLHSTMIFTCINVKNKLTINVAFYLRQLWLYNLGIHLTMRQ